MRISTRQLEGHLKRGMAPLYAVHGGEVYGTFPAVALGTSTDINRGSLLPTTSIDQYHATLAKWFGVSDADLATVVPNIVNFSPANLGFV